MLHKSGGHGSRSQLMSGCRVAIQSSAEAPDPTKNGQLSVFYVIACTGPDVTWTVTRCFSEFVQFRQSLIKVGATAVNDATKMRFPQRTLHVGKTTACDWQHSQRVTELHQWMNTVVTDLSRSHTALLQRFFEEPKFTPKV